MNFLQATKWSNPTFVIDKVDINLRVIFDATPG